MWKAQTLMFNNTFINVKHNYHVKVIDFYQLYVVKLDTYNCGCTTKSTYRYKMQFFFNFLSTN